MAITAGTNLNSVPAPIKQTLATNYIDFLDSGTNGWTQQYLPELMEKEAEVFGPRTIAGFLSQVGAEEPMMSDQVVWSEQGRLHLSYKATMVDDDDVYGVNTGAGGGEIDIISDIDDNTSAGGTNHGIRVNDTVIISDSNATAVCLVSAIGDGSTTDLDKVSLLPYGYASLTAAGIADTGAKALTVLVVGSEFAKGKDGRSKANKPSFQTFYNKPIILKDFYEISGSDTAQIGWVEVSGEDGTGGYLWYLKAEGDTRMRFTDYLEMSMLETVRPVAGSLIDGYSSTGIPATGSSSTDYGHQGLWAAIEDRGNITTGVTGVNAATDLAEFDAILAEFDKQGAIEENMMFVNRSTSLAMDDMLASMNSYGAGGTSYGVFSNSEDMALNLGFSGFRRGSYDFYKSDMRYLNDKATRGGINDTDSVNAIRGVMIPAGTSSVYDQQLGKNLKRPFLHVRYRASQVDDRRLKSWVVGSVGAATSGLDAMQIHYLSERCLITQGANNFMLMK